MSDLATLIARLLAGDDARELRLRLDPDDLGTTVVELVEVAWDDDAQRDMTTLIAAHSHADPVAALIALCDTWGAP